MQVQLWALCAPDPGMPKAFKSLEQRNEYQILHLGKDSLTACCFISPPEYHATDILSQLSISRSPIRSSCLLQDRAAK